ncbi:energy-coupling factor transporter transmembrane protein EcfT [Janibacter limosus]|uniref:Energy-coupling factor transporter transmembrane protein EcfT n=1 Tax=Janibacter limosus TaxID=53458 RepID=A0AC61U3F9_9MICO|nr:energy-coupling factor transporter transmembrane protein EcfT [Janibacter limosus]UUZ44524.1 energy-coupling factor transporter transmembrane protein EcfT [Janibacter limosus]
MSWRAPRSVIAYLWASTFGMLLRSLGSAATPAVAMDARGFASGGRRTRAEPAAWRLADTLVVLASVVTVLVVAIARL